MYSKNYVLDYLWQHSRFYHFCLHQSEELYRNEKGYAALVMLFNCLENIFKSAINDYDSRAVDIYKSTYDAGLISETEHAFLNEGQYCLRNIRNMYAHANIATINLIVSENGKDIYWPLTENDTSLLIYEKVSDIVFNLILKIISTSFIDEVRNSINVCLDDEIKECSLYFTTLTIEQLLVMNGFLTDYLDGCEDISEDAKIRLIDNAPDVGMFSSILSQIDNFKDE